MPKLFPYFINYDYYCVVLRIQKYEISRKKLFFKEILLKVVSLFDYTCLPKVGVTLNKKNKIHMKKLLIIGLSWACAHASFAQDAADKKVLAGLNLGMGVNFTQPQTNALNSKVGTDYTVGMSLDWHFSDNIALSTGFGFEFNRFRHDFRTEAHFEYSDKDILQRGREGNDDFITNPEGVFSLEERRYRNRYINIPTMLRFQTNYMGYMRYFGKFGAIHNILVRSRTDNFGADQANTNVGDLLDMMTPGDMRFYKASIGLSVGAEWNFAGSTVLVGEIGYYFGVTELHSQGSLTGEKERSLSLFDNKDVTKENRNYFAPTAQQGQLLLRVAVLF
jgi:hypothetical protein